jgi:hypothetical protein
MKTMSVFVIQDIEQASNHGWNAAIWTIACMLETEACHCISDIVSGDDIGAKQAHARAGALLTARDEILAMEFSCKPEKRDT